MDTTITVFGFGPVGRASVAQALERGYRVRLAQRHRPADLPPGVTFTACDVADAAAVRTAIAGAQAVVLTVGLAYRGAVWQAQWPRAMANLLDGCAAHDARLVFCDNLYMYGPQTAPLVETMPLSGYGRKPAARAAITRMWQADTRVRVAALRAPDFYGPGVTLSHLGETGLAAIAHGRRAMFTFSPDQPHDYAYVPDIGRAVVTLLDAPDDAYGRAWHVPCAPTQTSRALLAMGAAIAGRPLRLGVLPAIALDVMAPFVPFAREMREMRFQWDRPYRVDASAWCARFWSDPTPFATGVAATMADLMAAAAKRKIA